MWKSPTFDRSQTQTQDDLPRFPLHNIDDSATEVNEDSRNSVVENGAAASNQRESGTWGERDVGGPLNEIMAMEDYENLRRELTQLSKNRSKSQSSLREKRSTGSLRRSQSKGSIQSKKSKTSMHERPNPKRTISAAGGDVNKDVEKDTAGEPAEEEEEVEEAEEEEEFELDSFMREGHFEKRNEGQSAKRVGVAYKNLTVKGTETTASFVKTLPDAIMNTFGPDLWHLLTFLMPWLRFGKKPRLRTLVHDFTGVVRDGEMLLVLGRPGAGCSSFLKALANYREEYAEVTGDVSYGGIPADRQRKQYRGEVNYNPEDDVHFAQLNVLQTFIFALLTKTKRRERDEIPVIVNALLKMFGISHTKYTKVGDAFVRGISGGERKRVSIAETLATKSSVLCWDNSTRGLDASTALDYAKSLRIMTDVSNKATITTLYQAGEGIYAQMDKVLVIDSGRCIYSGPANEARQYFVDLGFDAPDRQTTADFLTACTDVNERRFRAGYEKSAPKTPKELEEAYRKSDHYRRVLADVENYEKELKETDYQSTKEFEQAVQEGKSHKTVSRKSPYTVSFFRQVMACTKREFWLLLNDTTTLYTKTFVIIANALIIGSLFYGESLGASGAFSRGGALFLSILFLGWLQLTELIKAVSGRGVVARQKEYAFYRPSAVSVGRILADLPILLPQVLIFALVMYFMSSLDVDVSKFWIYVLFIYTTTMILTSLYRMFAALSPTIDDAVRFSGISLNVLVIFTGYVIPKPQLLHQKIWFGWLYYINPLTYSFEGVLSNEFAFRDIPCDSQFLVPQGPGTDPAHQSCALPGAGVNQLSVPGSQYLEASYEYSRSHLWRNWGVCIAFIALYIGVTLVAVEVFNFAKSGGGALIFKKTYFSKKKVLPTSDDEENAKEALDSSGTSEKTTDVDSEKEEHALKNITSSSSVFTWEDVNYSVPYQGGLKQLLDNVDGYAKPGVMVALMGASGAGKTTLLNTLSQRQYVGVVSGQMMVDGQELGQTFRRSTGFCEQQDVHDGSATVREALEFSALLRQDRTIPRAEKLAYVDTVVDLLELNAIQDAVIECLGVEQRKRLTIGVELAAKPSLLLFLDEPTSGLDSQGAFSIIRFLKKLSNAGQAIVCTIHQPSSQLIQQFDMILALNPGGKTFYFGPVGEEGSAVIKYFGERGFQCPPKKNIAEFILETAAKSRRRADGTKVDWNLEWKNSAEAKALKEEIHQIKRGREHVTDSAGRELSQHEFAAPLWEQTRLLTLRVFRQYWPNPSYVYGQLFVATLVGIFNGFTFWQLGNTRQDLQNRMFSAFLILTIPPTVVNSVLPKFFGNMLIWQAREYPSRIYGWVAFTTAQVVGEIPTATINSVIYFCLWYFAAGFPTDSSVAGYVYFMTLLFFLFMGSWGQWITAFAPSFTVIANVLPFFFVMFSLFNGVVRPYASINVFWRTWMYHVNPSTWWISGVLAAVLHDIPVQCSSTELARFTPPPGMTCTQYAGAYAAQIGGYITPATLNSTSLCEFCMESVGDDYLASLNIKASQKWRDLGIFIVFVASNYALVYFFIWSRRVKGWGFGFGYLFGGLGKIADTLVLNPVSRLQEKRRKSREAKGKIKY